MHLTFRTALVGDIPILRDLADRIWRESYQGMILPEQIEYMLSWMYFPETIAAELAGGTTWELALLEDSPIGYLAVSHQPAHTELQKLYLLPAHQGHGHGQAMLVRAVALAATQGTPELRLRVNKRNARALRAYDRAGFQIVGALVADIGGGFFMDDYVLSWNVREEPHGSGREKSL